MSNKEALKEWEKQERERRLTQECDNPIYIQNLIASQERAKKNNNIEELIGYVKELERLKIICGYSPVIQQFEEAMTKTATELGLLSNPSVQRALAPLPPNFEQECSFCNDCKKDEKQTITMRGFDLVQIHEDGSTSFFKPEEAKPVIRNRTEEPIIRQLGRTSDVTNAEANRRKQLFPEICSEQCKHIQCPYRREENYGKKCLSRLEQYKIELKPLPNALERVPVLRSFQEGIK